jgi:hypothetical protein
MYLPLKSIFVRLKKQRRFKRLNNTVLQNHQFLEGRLALKTPCFHSETSKTLDSSDRPNHITSVSETSKTLDSSDRPNHIISVSETSKTLHSSDRPNHISVSETSKTLDSSDNPNHIISVSETSKTIDSSDRPNHIISVSRKV